MTGTDVHPRLPSTRLRSGAGLVGGLALLTALTGCGGDSAGAGSDTVAAERVPTTSPSPSSSSPSASTATSAAPASPVPSPATSTAPAFPAQAAPVHGGTVTAVYLAVAYTASDPALLEAQRQAVAVGYQAPSGGDVGCDQGAREALGLAADREYYSAVLYFVDRPTADQFVAAYQPGVVGTAEVTTYCLD